MRLITLGTGGYFPNPKRGGPAAAVLAGGEQFFVDAGENVARAAIAAGLALEKTSAIFFTHYHGDHISGLAHLLFHFYVEGTRNRPVPASLRIVGPPGLDNLRRGLLTAYGDWLLEPGFDLVWDEVEPPGSVAPASGVEVAFRRVEHASSLVCMGYRFTEGDRVLAVSGDSTLCEELLELSRDADVLLSESGCLPASEGANHINTKELGELATEARVKTLILTHFMDGELVEALTDDVASTFDGTLIAANDGDDFMI
ncbi:MAG: MBL fold metallo-hydrolase [Candidatus Lernaella stagnicola]|nr:MBL fold metallo-hydrolase [Candidatus Lernaella stagnicola]